MTCRVHEVWLQLKGQGHSAYLKFVYLLNILFIYCGDIVLFFNIIRPSLILNLLGTNDHHNMETFRAQESCQLIKGQGHSAFSKFVDKHFLLFIVTVLFVSGLYSRNTFLDFITTLVRPNDQHKMAKYKDHSLKVKVRLPTSSLFIYVHYIRRPCFCNIVLPSCILKYLGTNNDNTMCLVKESRRYRILN